MITFANQLSHRVIHWIRVRGSRIFEDSVSEDSVGHRVCANIPLDSCLSVDRGKGNMG